MEQFFANLVHAAAWFVLIVFVFAVIGVIAVVRWIVAAVTGTERAVESGVQRAESVITRRDK